MDYYSIGVIKGDTKSLDHGSFGALGSLGRPRLRLRLLHSGDTQLEELRPCSPVISNAGRQATSTVCYTSRMISTNLRLPRPNSETDSPGNLSL